MPSSSQASRPWLLPTSEYNHSCPSSWLVVRPMVLGPCMTNVGYSMPPVRDGVMASVYVGQAYGPKRALWVCSTLTALAANWAGLTPVPADAPTVTATGSGTWAAEVAMAQRPDDMENSRAAVAVQW